MDSIKVNNIVSVELFDNILSTLPGRLGDDCGVCIDPGIVDFMFFS